MFEAKDGCRENWRTLAKPYQANMKDEDATPKLLYTNKHGNIYEGDIVECFDIVAFEVKMTEQTKLTKKMIENARVIKNSQQ